MDCIARVGRFRLRNWGGSFKSVVLYIMSIVHHMDYQLTQFRLQIGIERVIEQCLSVHCSFLQEYTVKMPKGKTQKGNVFQNGL